MKALFRASKNFVSKLENRWQKLHAFEAPPGLVTSLNKPSISSSASEGSLS